MKKNMALKELIVYVKEQKFKRGDRLPSERDLAGILRISRTTIREALRILEERGILYAKRGSGVYINKNAGAMEIDENSNPTDEETRIKDQLEAWFMITPSIIRSAAGRATEEEINALRNCIVSMSRAIVARELKQLVDADSEFHRILAAMTRNHKLIKIMELLNNGNEIFWKYFIKNDEFVNNIIFAGFVEIVNAVKRKNGEEAAELAKRNIVNACEWLSEIKGTHYFDILGITKN
ncbi:MAG TPA: FCD domain-containing protein [Candidatus Deferrimicrobium sp.]|nr:FCD domain-containing protein [Candidatus Deferrimicrobium sp.]